jgi:sec-independent protein translocase protein TatA
VNFFGIGLPEMAVIMVIALLVFGPKKLPEIGRSMGKAIRGFQDASKDFEAEFKREAEQLEQAVKTPTLTEAKEVATKESDSTDSNNHATTTSNSSSQQS